MYCSRCGSENFNNSIRCSTCGAVLGQNQGSQINQNYIHVPDVPNYLIQSVLLVFFSTVLCCFTCISIIALPFAIVALIYSSQVNTKLKLGNIEGAMDYSRKAKIWCWVSFSILLCCIILMVLYFVLVIAMGFSPNLNRGDFYKYFW